MKLEQNLGIYNIKLNELKSDSIFKKSPEQRLKIYKDLKRAEAEKKKKEEEEKLLNAKQ